MTDEQQAALERSHRIIADADRALADSYARQVPERLYERPEPDPQYEAPRGSTMWAAIDRRVRAHMDVLAAATGDRLGKAGKRMHDEMQAALAERDERIAQLERRLAALEGERPAPPNIAHLITGGRKDEAA